MFCPFWMHIWYCLMFTIMEKVICQLKYCIATFCGRIWVFCVPLKHCRFLGYLVSRPIYHLVQVNKTPHNQWNKHIFGKNAFASWYSLRNICFWQKFKLVIFLQSPQILGGFKFLNKCHSQCIMPRCLACVFLGIYPLGLSSFKRRAIRFYHFTLNCTGNVRRMAILFQWDSRGVSWKMEF